MKRRTFKSTKRIIILCAAALLISITIGILWAALAALTGAQTSQRAAERWQKGAEYPYAQISAFISSDAGFDADRVSSLRKAIDSALTEASLTNDNGRLWYDCYSAEGKLSATGEYGSASVAVTAVGGEFFLAHELPFLSGWGFSPDELTDDRVVLDNNAAWQLFGSYDVVGQIVKISDKAFSVAGVVQRGDDDVYNRAYGELPRIYISYGKFSELGGGSISCYEAVMPNTISDFAYKLIKDNIGVSEGEVEIIENSARYSFLPLCSTISGLAIRSMRTSRILYPYWENVAGVQEDRAAVLLLFILILASILGAGLFIAAVKFITSRKLDKEKLEDLKYKLTGDLDRGASAITEKFRKRKD